MKMTKFTKILSVILCLVIVAAIAVMAAGCGKKEEAPTTTAPAVVEEITKIGEGATEFKFIAKDKDGKETEFNIATDAKTVGEALLAVGLIAGDTSDYGLYVKTVNGQTLDYDTDKMYWAFYVDGAYAEKGVDATEIVAGATYSFVATAG